jgi:hypothetical protein
MKPGETWCIEDVWALKPRQGRGRPHQSYKEAIDLYILSLAERIYRQDTVSPMNAIRRAVDEAWESGKHARLPDGRLVDGRNWLGPSKQQVVRRIRDRFRRQPLKIAPRGRRATAAASFPSPLQGTALGLALEPDVEVVSGGFSFGGLRALRAKRVEWRSKIRSKPSANAK